MRIRPAKLEDAPTIARIHVASWRAAYSGIVPQNYLDSLEEDQFTERWQKWIATKPTVSICVAEAGETLYGFVSGGAIRKPVSVYDGELYAIYLLPSMQRQGIGRELFAHMAREIAAQGISHLLLWSLQQNTSTGFYERLGGKLVAEDVQEIGGENLRLVAYGWSNLATRIWR